MSCDARNNANCDSRILVHDQIEQNLPVGTALHTYIIYNAWEIKIILSTIYVYLHDAMLYI